jgi:protein SCO1/2
VWRRTAAASLVVCTAGSVTVWKGTDGLRALTSEQARRVAIARNPRAVPATMLEDQSGRAFTLADYRGRPVVVEFIYTRCQALCTQLSAGMQRLDRAQRASNDRVQLVSISFDATNDSVADLREYAARYEADGATWRLARVRDERDLSPLLSAFGIVAIPDRYGGFQHNAAVHVLNAEGRLARVLDADAPPATIVRVAATVSR